VGKIIDFLQKEKEKEKIPLTIPLVWFIIIVNTFVEPLPQMIKGKGCFS